jgi:hypothetical protein
MRKILFQSNINQLRKVATKLAYNQKMDSTQVILNDSNKKRVVEANELIYQAIRLLNEVIKC